MATAVDIFNSALLKLGVEAIASFDEESKAANLGKEQYPKIRDFLLESHPWNFAMKREKLAISAEVPVFGFSLAYVLPVDCLRVWHLNNRDSKFKVENGRLLLTNLTDASLLYIAREEDVSKYSSQFKEALAYQLALDLGYNLIQDKGLMDRVNARALVVLRDARSSDGQEGTNDNIYNDEWLDSRFQYGTIGHEQI